MAEINVAKIAALNDHARHTFEGCRVVVTRGIQAMANVPEVLDQVRRYNAFSASNDLSGELDFGSFTHSGQTVFWKFDYYDLDITMHSPDPSDPTITARVLSVMLADEY